VHHSHILQVLDSNFGQVPAILIRGFVFFENCNEEVMSFQPTNYFVSETTSDEIQYWMSISTDVS
jgi:hypothetical protein